MNSASDSFSSSGESQVPANAVLAARSGDAVLFHVEGLGNMKNALGMWDFAEEMVEKGYRSFCLDLKGCAGMDSTFMGTLVGLSSRLRELGDGRVTIVNASRSNRELLEIVGADKFLELVGDCSIDKVEMEVLPAGDAPLARRMEHIRRAHEHLIDIDKRNEERFGAFLKALTSELEN